MFFDAFFHVFCEFTDGILMQRGEAVYKSRNRVFSGQPISRFENSEILHFFAIFECGPANREFTNWTLFSIPLYGPAIREFEKHDFL